MFAPTSHQHDLQVSYPQMNMSAVNPQRLLNESSAMYQEQSISIASPWGETVQSSSYEAPSLVYSNGPYYSSRSTTPASFAEDDANAGEDFMDCMDEISEGATDDRPYSELLHECLSSAPDNEMQLQDIYKWFETNTEKGRTVSKKACENSIRHNLSMNTVSYAILTHCFHC